MAITILLTVLFGVGFPQAAPNEDPLAPLKYLAGRWLGAGTGEPGNSTVEREYHFVLRGKFLQAKNLFRYTPQQKNPKGETHEDLGFMSSDTGRQTKAYRQFHVEGFLNQCPPEPIRDPKTLVAEALDNPNKIRIQVSDLFGDDKRSAVFAREQLVCLVVPDEPLFLRIHL